MANDSILELFGKAFIPKKIRPNLREYILSAGYNQVPYRLFGALFFLSIAITAIIYIFYIFPQITGKETPQILLALVTLVVWIVIPLGIAFLFMAAIYFYLDLKIFNRTKKIEKVLQEFLGYVSENLKGGMNFDKALWDAIRPRFGILADEIRLVAKRSITGQDLENALEEFTHKYDSPMVKRTFTLIIEGMRGGAPITDLIDRIQSDLRETRELKQEINATNTSFVILLTFIIIVIAPALFGLSFNLLVILGNIGEKIAFATQATQGSVGINIGEIKVEPNAFKTFSIYALGLIAVFTAMITSIIKKGNVKEGIKSIPIYAAGSIIMYTIFRLVFFSLFGSFG